LTALRDWATQRRKLEEDRPRLVAAAWMVGARSVAELARASGLSRDTIYSDLQASGIDYFNKSQDPAMTRLRKAVAQLAMQFNDGNPFSFKTRAAYGPPVAVAAALLVSFEDDELVEPVRAILRLTAPSERDRRLLADHMVELQAALDGFLSAPRIGSRR
jgi:DNA-binding phage protein